MLEVVSLRQHSLKDLFAISHRARPAAVAVTSSLLTSRTVNTHMSEGIADLNHQQLTVIAFSSPRNGTPESH